MSLVARMVDSPEAVGPYVHDWDALATAAGLPYCAPAWMLAWWRHAAPAKARLRIVLALDGDRLVGVAPLFAAPGRARLARYALLASRTSSPVEPLAAKGFEVPVAETFAKAIADIRPAARLVSLEGVRGGSSWPSLLAAAWPNGEPRRRPRWSEVVPTVTLDGISALDDWLKTRSANFRQELRRTRRRLLAQGAEFRLVTAPEEIDAGLAALARLHHSNWAARGGSGALTPGVERMLLDAAGGLAASGRLRLWVVDVGGTTIAARLAVAAGGELALWLSGFDERWSKYSPSVQSALAALEDAMRRGERRVHLGPGDQQWKLRFADGQVGVESVTLIPRGPLAVAAGGKLAAETLRAELASRVPPAAKGRIKAGVRHVRRR